MKMRWMKFAVLLLCLTMIAGAAHGENATTVMLLFQGLTAGGDGSWQITPLEGTFEVRRDGEWLGQLSTTDGQTVLTVAPGTDITLIPVRETMPEGFAVDEAYTVAVKEGITNVANVMAYADTGIFRISGKAGNAYTLQNMTGEKVMECTLGADGMFAPEAAVPAGRYFLRSEESDRVAAVFTVQAYRGSADQIAQVQEQQDRVMLLGNPEDAHRVWLVRVGDVECETLAALPEGWRVQAGDGVNVIHAASRDYVLMSSAAEQLHVVSTTSATDAIWYPMNAQQFERYNAMEEMVSDALQGILAGDSVQTENVTVVPADETQGITVSGTAKPNEQLLLYADEGTWVATSDAKGGFAFRDVQIGTGELRIRYMNDPDGSTWRTIPSAQAEENVDMTEAEATAAPALEHVETQAPTAEPTAQPTATTTPAPTQAPQASELTGSASLGVTVFLDANNNGERGVYERLMAGAQVMALYTMPGGYQSIAAQGVTDAEGHVLLSALPAGEYVLEVTLPAGYGFTKHGKTDKATSNIMEENSDCTNQSAAFTLTEGETREVGVGTMEMASLSGKIWLDENANGIMTPDEPGCAGVQVQLEGTKNGKLYETWSGEDGMYSFPQVKPGVYKLRVIVPEGMGFTRYSETGRENRSVITAEGKDVGVKQYELKSGTDKPLQHIGLIRGATLRGVCFLDANYNGLLDEGEQALPGVKLELIKQGTGKTVASMTTGDDGSFLFDGLRGGLYRLRAVLPEGTGYTCTVEGGNQFKARTGRREYTLDSITVENAETMDMVIGAIQPATISGTAYLDNNFSGTRDGKESVVSGLVVRLTDEQGNEIAVTRTNAKGVYTFEEVVPGRYKLMASAKTGYAFTRTDGGSVMLNLSDGKGESKVFAATLGANLTGMDMGMILPGVVEGIMFADRNDNGLKDADEGGLVGTVVRLMSEEGEHFSATIGEDGTFCFDAVMPGRYYLRYELPENAVMARKTTGGNAVTGDHIGATDWFDFATGDHVTAPLAGGLTLGQISGQTFDDHDGSGSRTEGKAPLAGVTLTLTPNRSDLETISIVTGTDGEFMFDQLHPDTYRLTVAWPGNLAMSRVNELELPLAPGKQEQTVEVVVAMGDCYIGQKLGGVQPASLRGTAWLDENTDGRRSSDEAMAAGIQVKVVDEATGENYATLTTAADGSFEAEGLIPGSYRVVCGLTDDLVAAKAGDSTFVEESNQLVMRGVQLAEGENREDLLLGLVKLNSLHGNVWVDRGNTYDMLGGAVVSLTDANGVPVSSMTTEPDGTYDFAGLLPGDYYVAVTLPEGYLVVEPEDERLLDGGRRSVMTQCSGRTGQSSAITVKMTEANTGLDIGSVLPGRLGTLCWLDENGNGIRDYDEKGLAGVKIELMRGDRVMAQVTSDQYGYWCMTEVYPATYTLRVTPPAEVKPTIHSAQVPALASVLEETDDTVCISNLVTVVSDRSNYQANLGFVLREAGVYPSGFGEYATQDWTKITVGE